MKALGGHLFSHGLSNTRKTWGKRKEKVYKLIQKNRMRGKGNEMMSEVVDVMGSGKGMGREGKGPK